MQTPPCTKRGLDSGSLFMSGKHSTIPILVLISALIACLSLFMPHAVALDRVAVEKLAQLIFKVVGAVEKINQLLLLMLVVQQILLLK